jgi:hypothetical protein
MSRERRWRRVPCKCTTCGAVPVEFPSLESRVRCKNAAVCRNSFVATAPALMNYASYATRGVCADCYVFAGGHTLDIVASIDECPVCYEPMEWGVKWNADSCKHRFCPACFYQMLYGRPRPPYECVDVSYAYHDGEDVEYTCGYALIHDDGRTQITPGNIHEFDGPIPDEADTGEPDDGAPFGKRTTCPICSSPAKDAAPLGGPVEASRRAELVKKTLQLLQTNNRLAIANI